MAAKQLGDWTIDQKPDLVLLISHQVFHHHHHRQLAKKDISNAKRGKQLLLNLEWKVFREFVFATVHLFSAEQLPKAWLRCTAWSVASILQLSRKTRLGQPVSVYEWEEIFKQFASNVPISWLLLRKVAFHFFVFSGKTLVWAQQWGRRWRLTWTRWGGWVGET